MAVSCYFGLTESGKSYHVENHVIPAWNKVVIFDNASCFSGDFVLVAPNDKDLFSVYLKCRGLEKFRIVIRPDRKTNTVELYNKVIHLAVTLGRFIGLKVKGGRVEPNERVQLVTDEADFVCSSHYQSMALKHLVNKGRHDNVDSHFIARVPMQIHTDIRRNATRIVSFALQNAGEIKLFSDNFGRELAGKIRALPKYHRLEWRDNGQVDLFDDKNRAYPNGVDITEKNDRINGKSTAKPRKKNLIEI